MKKSLLIAAGFAGLLILNSCSGIKVVSDVDPTIDWSNFKTYEYFGWAEESDKILNRFDKERIENAFGEEFKKRGLEYVESGGDMIVTLFIVVEQKKEATAHTTNMGGYYGGYYGYGPGYGWGSGHSTTTISEYSYAVGTLVVDVFDAKDEKLIWEGIGTKTVDEDPATRDKTIPKSVQMIMSHFPIKPLAE
ncbi:MAG: DUF4136 domain-containing protein [Bacteroidales bacterium]|nr:DUF4136 domain-containing protein [Bacteroidales bacterium]